MLFDKKQDDRTTDKLPEKDCSVARQSSGTSCFISKPNDILSKHIGKIQKNIIINYWSWGRFGMNDLLLYLLKQTGSSDVLISTWSLSETAMRKLILKRNSGLIKSIVFLLDPRIKVRNPVPFQMVIKNFTYKLKPCHAKVTLIENEEWNISIVSSMNMTENPRMERGVIFTDKETFDFDKNIICDEIFG